VSELAFFPATIRIDMDKIVKITIFVGMLFLISFVTISLKDRWEREQEYCSSCVPVIVDTYAKKYDAGGVELLSRETSTEEISKLAQDTQAALENDYCFKKCTKGRNAREAYEKRSAVVDAYIKQIDIVSTNRKLGLR